MEKNPDERRFLKAAAAAPKIRVADPAWNALEICKALDSCYAQRAKLIVLPELCLTGYTCQDLFFAGTPAGRKPGRAADGAGAYERARCADLCGASL